MLHSVHVDGTPDRLVITLTADRPIAGRLQQVAGGQTRLFLDLADVRPEVDSVIPVNRGPVLRLRVALNRVNPPVTRVVLDVSNLPAARLQAGERDDQLRIIVGGSSEASADGPPAGDDLRTREDRTWCLELAERVAQLLDTSAPSTSQPAMQAAALTWEELERSATARKIAPPLEPVHFNLLQAVRLGRIATTYRNTREFDQAAAAQAGARLLLNTARDRLAATH